MNRFKAAGIHLLISIFITISVLATMFLLWYPNEYFGLMGGRTLITLLASVDIFLGPLITLIIFDPLKKSLRFDLYTIAIFQLLALGYGSYVMLQSRPVFTAFNVDKFQVASVVDISPEELVKAKKNELKVLSLAGPKLVAIGKPSPLDKREVMFAAVESLNAFRYPRLYDDYNLHKAEVIKAGKPLADLYKNNAVNKTSVDNFVKKNLRSESNFLYLPISSELATMSAIVDAKTGEFIEIIDVLAN